MDNLTDKEKRLPAYERVGLALKLAGVSITVTSITNMFAFLIGATSVNRIYRYDSRSLYKFHLYKWLMINVTIKYFRVCLLFVLFASSVVWASSSCTFSLSHFLLRKYISCYKKFDLSFINLDYWYNIGTIFYVLFVTWILDAWHWTRNGLMLEK